MSLAVFAATIRCGHIPKRALGYCRQVLGMIERHRDSSAAQLAIMFYNLRLFMPGNVLDVPLDEIARGVARRIETLERIRREAE